MGDLARRDGFRASLYRIATFTRGQNFNEADEELLSTKLASAEETFTKFMAVHDSLVSNGASGAELQAHDEYLAGTEDVYHETIACLKRRISARQRATSTPMQSNVIQVRQERQPKLVTFNGELTKWREFRDIFVTEVHENVQMADITKFKELKQALEGAPARLINRWQISDANYSEAWSKLNEVYDNPQTIVDEHLNALHAMRPIGRGPTKSRDIRELINETNVHLTSLKALGVEIESWDPMMINMIRSRLDAETNRDWQMSRDDVRRIATLKEFLSFLEKRSSALESSFSEQVDRNARDDYRKSRPSTSGAAANRAVQVKCMQCRADHPLYRCKDFLALSLKLRLEKVRQWNLCANCLRCGHFASVCPLGSCRKCDKKHNSVLCPLSYTTNTTRAGTNAVVAHVNRHQETEEQKSGAEI